MAAYLHTDRKSKKKSYYYEFQYKKQKYKKSGFARKKDAEQAEDELKVKLRNGINVNEVEDEFNTHMQNWLDRRTDIGDNTKKLYQIYISNYFIPFFRYKKLKDTQPLDIQRFLDMLRDRGLSTAVQEKAYNIANKMFRDAKRLKLVNENPVEGVDKPRIRTRHKVQILNVEDLTYFLNFSKTYTRYAFAFFFAAHSGLRRGELLALTWDDIDFENKRLDVNKRVIKAAIKTEGYTTDGTKGNEHRNVALSDMVMEELRMHQVAQNLEKDNSEYQDNNLIIATQLGTSVHPDALTRAFRVTLKASGLENKITMHNLRHTHASLLLIADVGMKVVSERLGHSSIKITMDIYSHLLPKTEQEAADKFASLFRKSEPSPPEITREE